MSNILDRLMIWVAHRRLEEDKREQDIRALSRLNRPTL